MEDLGGLLIMCFSWVVFEVIDCLELGCYFNVFIFVED